MTDSSVAKVLKVETQRKRSRVASVWWPQVRLFAEIVYREIDQNRLFTQAAAMTYKTLFSLLPVFVLALLVLSMISAGGESGGTALDATMKQMIFQQLSLDKLAITDSTGHAALSADGTPLTAEQLVSPLLDRAKSAVNAKATGLIAFGILLYGAVTLMFVIEATFNQIYGSAKGRSWPRRLVLYWTVLTFGPLGVGASMVVGRYIYVTVSKNISGGWLAHPLDITSGIFISWLLLLLMYKVIPDTRVHWKPAAIGSFLAAILLQFGRWGFDLYVEHSLRSSWYGSLGLIPLFMLWIYLTWSFILLGLLLSYILQYYDLLKRRCFFTRLGAASVSDLRWVLSLGVLMYQRFKVGQTTAPHVAAEHLIIPSETATHLLYALESAGLAVATRHGEYALARPPESITAYDLLIAVQSICNAPPELAADKSRTDTFSSSPALKQFQDMETNWAKSQPLPTLAGDK